MKKWMVSVLVVALSIGMFAYQVRLMSGEEFVSIRARNEDYWWTVSEEEQVPRKNADQLLVADGVVYLYYEELGYVNAYLDDGTFLRGYQVACGQNGRGGIGYADGILYIKGQCSGIYLFQNAELVGFEEQSTKNPDYFACKDVVSTCCPTADGGYIYYYNAEAAQISRAIPGQALETVVRLPQKDSNVDFLTFANLVLWTAFVCGMRLSDNLKKNWI